MGVLERIKGLSVEKTARLESYLNELEKCDLVLIKEIVYLDPPSYYQQNYKRVKFTKGGKLVEYIRHHFSANLFFSQSLSPFTLRQIVYDQKKYLYQNMRGLPKLEKAMVEFEYYRPTDLDLDNKFFFWIKLFLDVLKTPTDRQKLSAEKYKKPVVTVNCVDDDNTKCIKKGSYKFDKGEHKMVFRLYGKLKAEQKELQF